MTNLAFRKNPAREAIGFAIAISFALINTSAVAMENAADLDAEAAADYNRGLDAKEAGQNDRACRSFENAAIGWENAVYALLGLPMSSEEDRDRIKSFASGLQSSANSAKAQAKQVCGVANRVILTPPPSSGSQSSSYHSPSVPSASELAGSVSAVQETINTAYANAQDAVVKYKARDFAGACASARASHEFYVKAQDQARAITKATSSFRDLTYDDIGRVDGMAYYSDDEAKEFYCAN
jgi:hypothetical protein